MLKGKKILVTGGSGFIGRALSKRLQQEGADVTVFDNLSRDHAKKAAEKLDDINVIIGDIKNRDDVISACKGQDAICHLAYINGTQSFYDRPAEVLDVAIRGMQNIVEACKIHQVSEFYYASSSEVYQTPEAIPTPETAKLSIPDIQNPRYSYGLGKILGEFTCLHELKHIMDRVLIFRPHNVYGPDMGTSHVIPELVQKLVRARQHNNPTDDIEIELKGDGSQTRAFIHIDHFTDALIHLIKHGESGEIYHIGSEEEITIKQLLSNIAEILELKPSLKSGPQPAGETDRRCADITKLKATGYKHSFQNKDGLQQTVRWYQDFFEGQ